MKMLKQAYSIEHRKKIKWKINVVKKLLSFFVGEIECNMKSKIEKKTPEKMFSFKKWMEHSKLKHCRQCVKKICRIVIAILA